MAAVNEDSDSRTERGLGRGIERIELYIARIEKDSSRATAQLLDLWVCLRADVTPTR